MMTRRLDCLLLAGAAISAPVHAAPLTLDRTTIVADPAGMGDTAALVADMLAGDLASLGTSRPVIAKTPDACRDTCVVIGRYDSPVIAGLARAGGVDLSALKGAWERHVRATIRSRGREILLIAGSDRRGAIYGVTDLSRALGVSPWSWWADVTPRAHSPRARDRVTIDDATIISRTPSVKYRGIFLNDEDWGLEPWAANTYDRAKGNIGPKTYARVYQLMWRLKANTLWPAMHSVSTPFFGDPGNPPLADRYAIVIGTSHAEPMMRNNLREWDEATRGPFDFTRRADAIAAYWRERVAATRGQEDIYTLGLRGIHDGPMQGVTTTAERQAVLERVFGLQQSILSSTLGRPIADIPQVFVAYHELQEAYDAGLKVPGDVTLMWTDDNYGWLRRLTNDAERRRPGGSGVYYHLSYWGRPHDYLWLGTTHPALIHEEMGRAWDSDARRMWIVNVGDVKPIEYLTQYFLDLAFDDRLFARTPLAHLTGFMAEQFGTADAAEIAAIMMRFYDLAWDRKPEFMGFGETEWVTPNRPSAYVQADGEEAQVRLAAYRDLVRRAEAVAARMPADRRDAFFQLVLYPVRGAAGLNTRILSLDLAELYARQQRAGANIYVERAQAAHRGIVADTAAYNALAGGKWRGIMDLAPRRLPVFAEPLWPHWSASPRTGCDIAHWGQWIGDENAMTFTAGQPARRELVLYGYRATETPWHLIGGLPAGLTLDRKAGALDAAGAYEQRLTIAYDGRGGGNDVIRLQCGGATVPLHIAMLPALPAGAASLVERDRRVTIPAAAGKRGGWDLVAGLGSHGTSLRAPSDIRAGQRVPPADYAFTTVTSSDAVIRVVGLPTHPVDPAHGLRIAVSIDGGAAVPLDLATHGRSDRWRGNVLSNTSTATLPLMPLAAGQHRITVSPLDPGVMLDRIEVILDRARPRYGSAE